MDMNMNMDFTDAFEKGMSEQEALEIIQRVCREEQEKAEAIVREQAAAQRAKAESQKVEKSKEDLLREGRAYLINAVLVYTEAFDLLEEGEEWTEEDIKELETAIIKMEKMIPMYVQLLKMQEKFDDEDFFKGLI